MSQLPEASAPARGPAWPPAAQAGPPVQAPTAAEALPDRPARLAEVAPPPPWT